MKRGIRFVLGLLVAYLMVFEGSTAFARGPSPYGPQGKRFGAGLYLGEPTGLTFKGYLTERWALDGVAAWSFVDDAFTLVFDGTYEFLDIPLDTRVITVPFYAGVGGKIGVNAGPTDRTTAAIRVPVGVAAQWVNYPVEVFLEIGPGVQVAPESDFDLTGGIGARFYF